MTDFFANRGVFSCSCFFVWIALFVPQSPGGLQSKAGVAPQALPGAASARRGQLCAVLPSCGLVVRFPGLVLGGAFFFAFLSGVLFFFVSLSLVFRSFPCWLPPSPRPLPWCRPSASPPCSAGSPCASSVCRPRPAFPSRSGSPLRVRGSLRGCAVGSVVRGRSVGRWLACAHPGLVCRCCRAGSPPLAFSCLCFLNFF